MNPEKIKQQLIKFFNKAWEYIRQARLELIIFAALLFADLLTKGIIAATMAENETVTIIPDFLNFTFVYNELGAFGSAFGLENLIGEQAVRVIFIILTFIAIGIFGYFLYRGRGKNKLYRISLAMILSGALGNLVDRLFIGKVRDFVEIVFFGCDVPLLGKSFAIFNVADAALVVGVIIFLVYFIFIYREPDNEEATADAAAGGEASAGSAEATGEASAGSAEATGEVTAGSAEATGEASAGNAEATGEASAGSAEATGEASAGSAEATGEVTAGKESGLQATGDVSHGAGSNKRGENPRYGSKEQCGGKYIGGEAVKDADGEDTDLTAESPYAADCGDKS